MKQFITCVAIVLLSFSYIQGQQFKHYLEDKLISAIASDQNNITWVGTQKHGLFKIENEQITQYTDFSGINETDIWSLYVDSKNRIWVGTGNYKSYKGSGAYYLENGSWHNILKGLPSSLVLSFFEDNQGTIWISTGKGIAKYQNGNIEIATTDKVNKYFPRTVKEDADKNIWISDFKSLFKLENGQKQDYDIKPFWFAWDFEFQADTVWVGMYGGFFRKFYNGKSELFDIKGTKLEKHYGMAAPGLANDVHIDKANSVWFTSYSGKNPGILQYKNGEMIQHKLNSSGAFRPRKIHEDSSGQIWICLQSYGTAVYNYDSNTWKTYGKANGIISDEVSRIHIDKTDNIWVGTGKGLTRISN